MRKHFALLLTFLAALAITSPVYAGPTEEAKAENTKAEDTKAEEAKTEKTKADEAEAEDTEAKESPDAEGDAEADGPAKIEDDDEAVAAVKQLIDAAKNGHWSLVVALGIMLLVYVIHRFGLAAKLGKKAVPWIAAATGVLGYVAAALLAMARKDRRAAARYLRAAGDHPLVFHYRTRLEPGGSSSAPGAPATPVASGRPRPAAAPTYTFSSTASPCPPPGPHHDADRFVRPTVRPNE